MEDEKRRLNEEAEDCSSIFRVGVLAKYELTSLHLYNVDYISEENIMRFGNTLVKSRKLEAFSFAPHRFVNITNIEYLVNAIDQVETVNKVFFDLS
jgi:hypothetical protein